MELNKIYNENCLDTMRRMPDGFVDLTVTSPPYDNLREYKGYEFPFEEIANDLYRVTKKGGVVVWVVGDATINGSETGTSFRQALYFKEIGFNLHDTMIYDKVNYIPLTRNRYEQAFEYMFVLSKTRPICFNAIIDKCISVGSARNRNNSSKAEEASVRNRSENTITKETKYKNNIWSYVVGSNKDNTLHPAPFPEKLARDHIYSWSNEGDIVYDPFGGSGTTAKMAHLQKRKWIMSEISAEYCELATKRLEPYLTQTMLDL
jgi:site-specific DNA-methyltransferase (adenine-specific)